MAQQPQKPIIEFENIPLEQVRSMGRGPRMDPPRYQALKDKPQSLGHMATRMTLPLGANSTTMKNRIARVAHEVNVAVTIRRVPGGLLFWRSSDEDVRQAQEIAQRLHPAQRERQKRRRRGRT
jgi:hypothetical protein